MRIVLVNWAPIWEGAVLGGGVNGYAQRLALALRDQGHDLTWLSSGWSYTAADGRVGPIHLRRHPDWLGVRVVELINSPIIAPAAFQRGQPEGEISQPQLEQAFADLVARLRPDVVHLHNLEGLSAGCIHAVRALQPRPALLYSLHNYHTLTPTGYLPARAVEIAERLVRTEALDGQAEKLRRAGIESTTPALPTPSPAADAPDRAPPAATGVKRSSLLAWLRGAGAESPALAPAAAPPREPHEPDPDEAVAPPLDQPFPAETPEARGQTIALQHESLGAFRATPDDLTWQPMEQSIDPEPGPDPRRDAMIAALNACDAVLAVSEFVRDRYQAEGVRPELLRFAPIGTAMVEIAQAHRELPFAPVEPPAHRPLHVAFLGYDHPYKGLDVVADAMELLSAARLARIRLSIFAQGGHRTEWRFRRLEPRLAGLRYGHGYRPQDVPWVLGGVDAVLVPSIWFDNGPQTQLEAFACGVPVVGSRLGGIATSVRDGVDGLLFRGNDRADLARAIARLLDEPGLISALRAGVRRPASMREHAEAMRSLYAEALSSLHALEAASTR